MNTILNKRIILATLFSLLMLFGYAEREKVVQIFRGGEVVQEYAISDIDYIEVNDRIEAPSKVEAEVDEKSITITWNAVEGATYNVYRSADNVNFTLLAKDLKETTYTDSEPLSGSNFYKVKAIVDGHDSAYTQSAAASFSDTELPSGVYLGITGFNQNLSEYPVHRLSKSSVYGFSEFINGLEMKNGTILYYSFDKALDALQASKLPTDLTTAAIVTFTDGLDQGSFMMNSGYENNEAYLEAMNQRIKEETVSGLPIEAYSIGLRGSDVNDYDTFRRNLEKLSSSSENATEVSSMDEVNARFRQIAEHLTQNNYLQTINLTIPGLSNGTRVRFTFDNVSNAEWSNLYIEGRFNLSDRSLEDVVYVGLTSTSGTTIKGKVDGIFVTFTFDNVHTETNTLINKSHTDEWNYVESSYSWQINSEFDKNEDSEIVTNRSSAAIMLVLDCSSSLKDDFVKAKKNAKDFIETLFDAVSDEPFIVVCQEVDGVLNGHDYVDLGLPSGLKWATCNIGANISVEYGSYFAWGRTSDQDEYGYCYDFYDNISGDVDYDAVRANWEDSWRMPTQEEFDELINNCQWTWVSNGNYCGYKVTGPNGKFIFLPAAGYISYTSNYYVGLEGFYWSSTPYNNWYDDEAFCLWFSSGNLWMNSYDRNRRRTIRPVSE